MIRETTRAITLLALSVTAYSQESYSPHVNDMYPKNVYWGDTHLHTNLSIDANTMGNDSLGLDEAYRFARGETIIAHNGMKVRSHRSLDFLVVADHGINMGVLVGLENKDPVLLKTEKGRELYQLVETIRAEEMDADERPGRLGNVKSKLLGALFTGGAVEGYRQPVWQHVIDGADRHNDPGKFTAFIGYEWTPIIEGALGVHRVVIFKDGANKAGQVVPFTAYDSKDPEDLWAYLADYQAKTGGDVLAIPHNGNLTAGAMFSLKNYQGDNLNRQYAVLRSRWEPLFEVTQIKGTSETHPFLSPTDEFADYEIMVPTDFSHITDPKSKEPWRRQYEYARSALKMGLDQKSKLGVNPFKFGLIGSTDAHTGLATAEENNFWGKTSLQEPSAHRMQISAKWKYSASGYAAIWATENTREALFAAMRRRETYATTGPRMMVRFFGGWNFDQIDAQRPDLARTGYTKGVPMGGDLSHSPQGKSPGFLIHAVKDPDGANLDRVQVVKGWRSKDGTLYEKIYNVALSDGRKEDKNGKAPLVGSTVNIAEASYTNSIGDPELAVVWTDPDFNAKELAFYYVRVLEIPTPRWTAYDAKYFGLKDIPEEVPMVTQERAYTSPIWHTP